MHPSPDPLAASSHPVLGGLLLVALGAYVLSAVVAAARPAAGRWLLGGGVAAHLAATVGRGAVIGFFPLGGRMESFSAAALSIAAVTLVAWRPRRAYVLPLVLACAAVLAVALSFPQDLRYTPPILRTAWYPLHVPSSFVCYAIWFAAGAAGLQWRVGGRDPDWLRRVDRLALLGFGLWSVSMVFGAIWGLVAWGAWFLWDPKFIWSVILWFHYASFVHLPLTPSVGRSAGLRVFLAWLGCLWVVVAWVGTSFFFGKSTHAF